MVLLRCFVAAACLALTTGLICDAPSNDERYGNTFVIDDMSSFQQSGYETIGSGACTVIRGNLRIQCASSAVANSRGGPIANLTFLSSLSSVLGYVHIENCNDITTLSPLAGLGTIGGSPGEGLFIFSCAGLKDLKGIENLQEISQGGVTILKNEQLCYADLMNWERIATGTTSNSKLVHVLQMNATCTSKQCDESCFCGYCGGPGGCAEAQSEECEPQWTDLPDWVDDNEGNTVGYVILIIFSTLLSILFAIMLYGCIRKKVTVSLYISAERPAPIEVAQFRPIVNRKLSMDVLHRRASGLSMSASPEEASNFSGDSAGRQRGVPGPGGISPVIEDDAVGTDAVVTTSVAAAATSPDSPTSEAADPNLTETFRLDETQENQPEGDLSVEDQVSIAAEPAPTRPLKPFSNFLAVEKPTIDQQLEERRTVDPTITSQKVAAEMWQVDPAIQIRFKAEYEEDMAVYEDYVGLATYKEQGNHADGWGGLPDPEKKSYVKAGLANEKGRRRAGRAARKSQINLLAIRAMSGTTPPTTPAGPRPRPGEAPHRPLDTSKRNKLNPLVIQGEVGGAHDQKDSPPDPDSPPVTADAPSLPPADPAASAPEPPHTASAVPTVPEEPDALPAPPPPPARNVPIEALEQLLDAEADPTLPPPAPAPKSEPEGAPAPPPAAPKAEAAPAPAPEEGE